jgi:hypothetical protein
MLKFQDAMRRVITGDNAQGQSVLIIDGGPSSEIGNPDLGGLFEIWEDAAFGTLTPSADEDLGATRPVLGPRKGNFQVRWFVISPLPEGGYPSLRLTLPCANGLPKLAALVTSSIRRATRECMRPNRSTSSVSCREKHLSSSKVAKLDCGQATWSSSAGPTTPGTHMVVLLYSWPF